jgi:hypothetical protein
MMGSGGAMGKTCGRRGPDRYWAVNRSGGADLVGELAIARAGSHPLCRPNRLCAVNRFRRAAESQRQRYSTEQRAVVRASATTTSIPRSALPEAYRWEIGAAIATPSKTGARLRSLSARLKVASVGSAGASPVGGVSDEKYRKLREHLLRTNRVTMAGRTNPAPVRQPPVDRLA